MALRLDFSKPAVVVAASISCRDGLEMMQGQVLPDFYLERKFGEFRCDVKRIPPLLGVVA